MRGEAEADILEREADEGMGSASDAGSGAGRGGGSDSDDRSDCASAVTGEDEGPPSVGGLLDDDAFAASEADDLGEPESDGRLCGRRRGWRQWRRWELRGCCDATTFATASRRTASARRGKAPGATSTLGAAFAGRQAHPLHRWHK